MVRAPEFNDFYNGWADQQQNLLDSLRPLSSGQLELRAAPGEWAIWQLASQLKVDHTTVPGLSLEWAGWEDNEDRPRSAEELEAAFHKTWVVVEACINRWSLDDLRAEVSRKDAWGQTRTMTRASVIWRLMAHEVHHGSEISLILRVHGLPTAISR